MNLIIGNFVATMLDHIHHASSLDQLWRIWDRVRRHSPALNAEERTRLQVAYTDRKDWLLKWHA